MSILKLLSTNFIEMDLPTTDNWRCALVQDAEPRGPGVAAEDQHDGDVPPEGRHQVSNTHSGFSAKVSQCSEKAPTTIKNLLRIFDNQNDPCG